MSPGSLYANLVMMSSAPAESAKSDPQDPYNGDSNPVAGVRSVYFECNKT